mgnify:CR=1 FL=1
MIESILHDLVNEFHFLRPLWALLFIPFGVFGFVQFKRVQRKKVWQGAIAKHLLVALTLPGDGRRLLSPLTFFVMAMCVFIVLLMGPSWAREPSPFESDNAVLYIALDVSNSMTASDIQPSRLVRAKQKMSDLLELRPAGRLGLIVYSGSAHTVLPLSSDPNIVRSYLNAITPNIMPQAGKFAEKILRYPITLKINKLPACFTVLILFKNNLELKKCYACNEFLS